MAVDKKVDAVDLAKRIKKSVNEHLAEVRKEHESSPKNGSAMKGISKQSNSTPKIGSIL